MMGELTLPGRVRWPILAPHILDCMEQEEAREEILSEQSTVL